jgi:hypothetical protein
MDFIGVASDGELAGRDSMFIRGGETIRESPQLDEDGSVHYCGKITLMVL